MAPFCIIGQMSENIISGQNEEFPLLSKKINVCTSNKNRSDKHTNQYHFCVYCEKQFQDISRHISRLHKNESDVARNLNMNKKSKICRKAWLALVNKGDFSRNFSVLQDGHGEIIPKYRKRNEENIHQYVPCSKCRGMYTKSSLWKHQ